MRIIRWCLVLFLVYSIVFLNKLEFDDWASYSGDTKEYQAMAVNLAKGYGLMKGGAVAGDYVNDYKFDPNVLGRYYPPLKLFLEKGKTGGYYKFYRTPGYIVFLAGIYKLFGVSPQIAKTIQLLLITFIAAFLPYLGLMIWKKKGFWAGLIAGGIYLTEYARTTPKDLSITYPYQLMTEGLISFWLFIWVWLFLLWEKNKKPLLTLILGILTGLSLLIKGSNIFIPLVMIIYLGSLVVKKKLLIL